MSRKKATRIDKEKALLGIVLYEQLFQGIMP